MRGLLADLDDAPEEGVFVGCIGAVAFDDGVDAAVLGEVHCWRDLGVGVIWVSVLVDVLNCFGVIKTFFL